MPISWDELQLYNIDLHFHAGNERPPQYSMRDYIDFALASGRKIVGITDHFGFYLGRNPAACNHYPGSIEGYTRFCRDILELRRERPDAVLLAGPEIGLNDLETGAAEPAFSASAADFFMGEPGRFEGELGEYLIDAIEITAEARNRYGCPGFLSHPLRHSINTMLGKTGPGPRMPRLPPLPPFPRWTILRTRLKSSSG